ncbi:23623_t:CDS:2 [Gigaspora rosea]|nr:23623_t:CDS:2 [Gigaspora rosea]
MTAENFEHNDTKQSHHQMTIPEMSIPAKGIHQQATMMPRPQRNDAIMKREQDYHKPNHRQMTMPLGTTTPETTTPN